jgi:hypothetical protein
MTDSELCNVGFEGGEPVGCRAVEGCAGEVAHRGDGGAECPEDLELEDVELGIAKEAELEDEVLVDEESSGDAYSAFPQDCVRREVDRAWMMNMVVRFSSSC